MNSVKFLCPACRQKLEADADMFGTKLQCPVCNAWMQVPNGPAPAHSGVAPASPGRPGYAVALGVGAAFVVLLAGALTATWWFGLLPGRQKNSDMSAYPEWSPQVASSSLQSASGPGAIEEGTSEKTEKVRAPVSTSTLAAAAATSPRQGETKATDVALPKPPPTEERPKEIEEPPQRPERVLSEVERRKVFTQLLAADDKAQQETRRQMPDDPTQAMEVGSSLKLMERTPLFRAPPSADAPQAQLEEMGKLQAATTILVVEVRPGRTVPWYRVEASDRSGEPAGKGWVCAATLTGQSREDMDARHVKQQRLQADLLSQYQRGVENEHGITTDQARKILSEGLENQWDGAKRADITGE
jgi:hypothetical protein